MRGILLILGRGDRALATDRIRIAFVCVCAPARRVPISGGARVPLRSAERLVDQQDDQEAQEHSAGRRVASQQSGMYVWRAILSLATEPLVR
jgi:hypothetical protein